MAAAYRIQKEISEGAPLECILLEGGDRFGGKIATERSDGFVIERGPDSFISQKPAPVAEGEAPKSTASKCPFSGALAEMGIDITKMSKEEAMEKMGDMSKLFPDSSGS